LAIALSALLKLHDNYGIHIVGEISASIPSFSSPMHPISGIWWRPHWNNRPMQKCCLSMQSPSTM